MEVVINGIKYINQSEVDAIRADTWYAARKITDKVVGEIDFKDGDRCPFYEKYFNSINDYLSSLNLNSNDTGKEDNETKSANWRSENLSKQSAPEPSALPNKEYEIVEAKNFAGYIHPYIEKTCDHCNPKCTIHSVRRFPDNTVWSCQETVSTNRNRGLHKILSFKIIDGDMCVQLEDFPVEYEFLYQISKLPTPTEPVVEDKPTDSMKLMKQIQKWKDTYDKPLSEWTAEDRMEWESSDMNIQQFIASKIPN